MYMYDPPTKGIFNTVEGKTEELFLLFFWIKKSVLNFGLFRVPRGFQFI